MARKGGSWDAPDDLARFGVHSVGKIGGSTILKGWSLTGWRPTQVTFVACMRKVDRGPTNIHFVVEDGTGESVLII